MESSPDHQLSSYSSSSSSGSPTDGHHSSSSAAPPAKRQKREYDSQKRVESYTTSHKPAFEAVREAAVDSLLLHLTYHETTEEVWLRDVPQPSNQVEGGRPYYWAISGTMTPTEEEGWEATVGRGNSGPSQTGSRWGTENLHILEGMMKSGRVRPFFADEAKPAVCGIVARGSNVLGLGWGLMGDHEDPSTYGKEKYAAKGITLLRELPDAADRMVPGLSGGPKDGNPKGKKKNKR
ncbi:hypothetical protein TWF788_009740 [Orbilia oligospora]|uniref:Uncharacterized protein n=1 Tax=Orbilia oligospora TaxID=2813651 RepID=A0A7C8U1T3_ORBOL|nr:hypothetical protein TWF788_009740 [Orbilia oligospora]